MRILFSPVGDSDPIRDCYDGSCLHIIRHYKPDAVKLFFTKDMANKEEKDHRYTKAIKHVAPNIEIIQADTTDIVAANSFDIYMDYFPKSIMELVEKNPDAEILVNISSGTTQMKTTLAMLSVDLPNCKAIQVSTPAKGSNRRNRPEQDDIDVDELINNNLDEEDDAENRCEEPGLTGIKNFREKNQILSLIEARRYGAAWNLAKEPSSTISEDTCRLLEYGYKRSKLELKAAKTKLNKEERDKLHTVKDDTAEKLFEYFLVMDNHALNKEYAELLVKLTPFMYELLKEHIKRNINCNDFFESCCEQKTKNGITVPVIIREKIDNWNHEVLVNLDSRFGLFKDTDASFINLFYIISAQSLQDVTIANKRLLALFDNERGMSVERLNNLRNTVAHNIIMNITEAEFENKTGLEPKKIIDVLFDALRIVFDYNAKTKISKEARDSYKKLNQYIKRSMENF